MRTKRTMRTKARGLLLLAAALSAPAAAADLTGRIAHEEQTGAPPRIGRQVIDGRRTGLDDAVIVCEAAYDAQRRGGLSTVVADEDLHQPAFGLRADFEHGHADGRRCFVPSQCLGGEHGDRRTGQEQAETAYDPFGERCLACVSVLRGFAVGGHASLLEDEAGGGSADRGGKSEHDGHHEDVRRIDAVGSPEGPQHVQADEQGDRVADRREARERAPPGRVR